VGTLPIPSSIAPPFGFSIGDIVTLTQLAKKCFAVSQTACGENDPLTCDLSSLHTVLQRVEEETAKPESPIHMPGNSSAQGLRTVFKACEKVLVTLNSILVKYNGLSKEGRSGRKIWQKVRSGNGEVADVGDLRRKIVSHSSTLKILLNLGSQGSLGEDEMQTAEGGGDLKDNKGCCQSYHSASNSRYNDDQSIWREIRRELVIEGFTSSIIPKHKALVKSYVAGLGDRGLLDNGEDEHEDQQEDRSLNVETNAALDFNGQPEGLPISVADSVTASTLRK